MAQRCGPERPVSPACSPRSGEGRECICTVCTCGFHKCPRQHTSVHTRVGNALSEYGANYPEWPIPEKLQRKIAPPQRSNARMAFTTTYNNHYVNHPLSPSTAPCRPTPKVQDTGPFQKETTYNIDYWDKSAATGPRAKAPQAQHIIKGKSFEGQSVYQLEYPNHGPQPRNDQLVVRPGSLGIEGARFDGDSTYHDDYRQWQMPARYVHKVDYTPQPPGKVCSTTYQSDYVERQMQSRCPALTRGIPCVRGSHVLLGV